MRRSDSAVEVPHLDQFFVIDAKQPSVEEYLYRVYCTSTVVVAEQRIQHTGLVVAWKKVCRAWEEPGAVDFMQPTDYDLQFV